ncbi:hypothetical protein [Armatimonas rosea]|uniref:Uncharacterized protein n=1 Tax=Armatimonas rosea TaxID=685828 RepID=A0A7W9W837_ARMRO|nr:hypothetical protein [Armatimonas rosea]MBB6051227.1 hypothetical protein [Armatimonas rosea]
MQRKTFLALTTGGLLAALLGEARAQEAVPRRQKRFTPTKPLEAFSSRPPFPYALVEERPGLQLYSPRFNEIIGVVPGEAVEWVATPVQVKRVDRKRNDVRLYDQDDGLMPGTILGLVGEGDEAYVLVKGADNALALCAFDPTKDRFESFPLEGTAKLRPTGGQRSRPQLVLGQDTVAFIPELISPRLTGVPPFFTFDRRTRKLENGSWSQELLRSLDPLMIAFAAVVGGTLWLGTQVGVLGVPLPAQGAAASWPRSGPLLYVRCGAALPDGAFVLLTYDPLRERTPTLLRLDPKTGQTSTVSWGSFALMPNGEIPLLMPDGAGGVWQIGGMIPGDTTAFSTGPSVHRLKSLSATTWEKVSWSDAGPNRPVLPGVRITLAQEETLPTPVAAALVCYLLDIQYRMMALGHRIDQDMWLRQRFWRWCSPEPPAQVPPELVQGGMLTLQRLGITDTKDPAKTWLGEVGGFALAPKRELDPREGAPRLPVGLLSEQRIETPGAQHFPVEVSRTRSAISVGKFLRGKEALVITQTERNLLRLTKEGPVAVLPAASRVPRMPFQGGVSAGSSGTCFVWSQRGDQQVLLRWDESKQALVETVIPLRQTTIFELGGTKQGLWMRGASTATTQVLSFLAIAPDGSAMGTWETLTLELPAKAQCIGFGATAVWFQSFLPTGKFAVHAWDTEKRCWSSVEGLSGLVMTSGANFQTVESPDGASWLFLGGAEPGLLRYDPAKSTLELASAANTVLKPPKNGVVIAATREAVWVAGFPGYWRYDQAKRSWSKPEQAQGGLPFDSVSQGMPYSSIPDNEGGWWVGANQALWRFDPVRGSWQEQTLAVSPELGVVMPSLVTDDTVWGMAGALVARLDRKTGKARTYGKESGVVLPRMAMNLASESLQTAGGRLWMLAQPSLIYFDAKEDRFLPVDFPEEKNPVNPRRFTAIVSDPWRPQGVIVLVTTGPACKLYRGEGGKFDPTPLPQPPELGMYFHLAVLGRFLYVGAMEGLWRIDASGRWERVVAGMRSTRFFRDREQPDVLWALGASTFRFGPDPIVRIGPG